MKKGKRYSESAKLVDSTKQYEAQEAIEIIEKMPKTKFDQTVELHVKLGVDSKHADQQVRGTVVLPHGTGKTQRVLVFAKGDKAKEAEEAGADFVGAEELVPKIEKENWFEYDVIVATPDMMGVIGRLGKVLGPKGLMPNPKSGTVTMDVKKAIAEIKSGKVEYRLDKTKEYEAKEAIEVIEKMPKTKFDETVELHVKLGVDSKHADQQVRGTVVLPNGTGKTQRVLVFAKGPKAEEAQKAGADFVGAEELIPKIQNDNWFEYDVVVATPDMMGVVGRLGKVLGPKGLMPNPKSGTVTMDVTKAISEIKSGKVEYRLDKNNIIHLGFGKVSFGADKLLENYDVIMNAIIKAKPAAAKGQYIKSVAITTTMGPSIFINQK